MNKMTYDEMLKYSAELVVKNNPDEAVKLLVILQKENKLLKETKLTKQFPNTHCVEIKINTYKDRINKAIEYIDNELLPFGDEWHWDNAAIENLVVELRTKLRGEDNE